MRRSAKAFLAVFILLEAGLTFADTAKKDTTPSPSEQYQGIVREYDKAMLEFKNAYGAAKTAEERRRVMGKYPWGEQYLDRFLKLAEKYPKDPVAVDSLVWVVNHARGKDSDKLVKAVNRALALFVQEYLADERITMTFSMLTLDPSNPTIDRFFRTAMEKSPSRPVRGRACISLGRLQKHMIEVVLAVKEEPKVAQRWEKARGKEGVQRLREMDPERLRSEAETLFEQVIARYGDVKYDLRGTLAEQARAELFEMRQLSIGKTAPDLACEDIDGKQFKLSDYRGKVVVLVFWGHWCGPCRAMYPHERSLVQRMAGKPFALVGINSDKDREALKKTMEKEEITWRIVWDGGSPQGPLARGWNVSRWPTIYVLDGKGVIRYRDVRDAELDKAIDTLLATTQTKD